MRLLTALLLLSACASPGPLGRPFVVSLEQLTCEDCPADLDRILGPRSGILETEFRREHAELHVRYAPQVTSPQAILLLLEREGYRVRAGAGLGSYLGGEAFPTHGDVAWVEERDWETIGVPAKVTVLQREDPLCTPCKKVDRVLAKFLEQGEGVAVRRLRTEAEGPYAVVFDSLGNVVDRLKRPDAERMKKAVEVALTL